MVLKSAPQFVWDHHAWTTSAVFSSWKGFQSRNGAYGGQDQLAPSDGSVRVVFAPEGRPSGPLQDVELAAVRRVLDREPAISTIVLSSIFSEYPKLQLEFGYEGKERDLYMPDIASSSDLRSLVGLYSVNVHQVQKDGIPYAGFEFGCTWDQEHGLGVLMHGTRTVAIGGADTAFLLWIAKKDGGLPLLGLAKD